MTRLLMYRSRRNRFLMTVITVYISFLFTAIPNHSSLSLAMLVSRIIYLSYPSYYLSLSPTYPQLHTNIPL